MTEQEAEAEVLRICRTPRKGVWCMRELSPRNTPRNTQRDITKGLKVVIDNALWSSPLVAQGHTWAEVLAQLEKK